MCQEISIDLIMKGT